MTIRIDRKVLIGIGVGLLVAGLIALIVVIAGSGGGPTVDGGELRVCLDREVGTGDVYPFTGAPSDAQTSFSLRGSSNPLQALLTATDVYVFKDSGAAEDAASNAEDAAPSTAGANPRKVSSSENVMWVAFGDDIYSDQIRNCIGEAS